MVCKGCGFGCSAKVLVVTGVGSPVVVSVASMGSATAVTTVSVVPSLGRFGGNSFQVPGDLIGPVTWGGTREVQGLVHPNFRDGSKGKQHLRMAFAAVVPGSSTRMERELLCIYFFKMFLYTSY